MLSRTFAKYRRREKASRTKSRETIRKEFQITRTGAIELYTTRDIPRNFILFFSGKSETLKTERIKKLRNFERTFVDNLYARKYCYRTKEWKEINHQSQRH